MPWPVLVVGALICAGAALAPDLDHKSATISRAFGPISRGAVRESIDKLSYAVYKATRKQGDPRRSGGHRTLTHTWLWAVLIGAGLLGAGGRRRPLGGAGDPLRPHGAGRRGPAVAGGPGLQRRPGVAARRDQRLDPGRRPGQAGQRLGLAVHRARPGVPVARACRSCSAPWCTTSATRSRSPAARSCGPSRSAASAGTRWARRKFMRFRAGSWVELKVLMPVFMLLGGAGGAARARRHLSAVGRPGGRADADGRWPTPRRPPGAAAPRSVSRARSATAPRTRRPPRPARRGCPAR